MSMDGKKTLEDCLMDAADEHDRKGSKVLEGFRQKTADFFRGKGYSEEEIALLLKRPRR
jgi:hypothetical protein